MSASRGFDLGVTLFVGCVFGGMVIDGGGVEPITDPITVPGIVLYCMILFKFGVRSFNTSCHSILFF